MFSPADERLVRFPVLGRKARDVVAEVRAVERRVLADREPELGGNHRLAAERRQVGAQEVHVGRQCPGPSHHARMG